MCGYTYGQHEPTEECPYCKTICRADFVDIGVGMQQCGPFHCDSCGASEIGAFDAERELTDEAKKFGWYAPGAEPGASANVIGGRIVSHVQMRGAYEREFVGNMLWHDKKYVEDWFARTRHN